MPQLHLSVDERTAEELADRAEARGESLSKYLASLVKQDIPNEWPKNYLASVVGSCANHPLEAPADLSLDEIDL